MICRRHPRYYFANGSGHGGHRVGPDSRVLHLGGGPLLCGLHRCSATGLYISWVGKDPLVDSLLPKAALTVSVSFLNVCS